MYFAIKFISLCGISFEKYLNYNLIHTTCLEQKWTKMCANTLQKVWKLFGK